MNISIEYSVENEIYRVVSSKRDVKWFNENGYILKLPSNVTMENLENLTDDELTKIIKSEFLEEDYLNAKNELLEMSEKHIPTFNELCLSYNLKIQDNYKIIITKYGTGGSYVLPNTIILNFNGRFGIGPIRTIMHEIVHLAIEPLISKYSVKHWDKERIVDKISEKVFGKMKLSEKTYPTETATVDEIFDQFFPDIEKITEEVGNKK